MSIKNQRFDYAQRPKSKIKNIAIVCIYLILCGCIEEYEVRGVEEVGDILVVEGMITDHETVITLSRSVRLSDFVQPERVDSAEVYVEREDGVLFKAELQPIWIIWGTPNSRYVAETGTLSMEHRYRLRIKIEEDEYVSDFSYPLQTPEIDSIFWTKRGLGQWVSVYVATHDPNNQILHYRWSYTENWEIHSEIWTDSFPSLCWGSSANHGVLTGSASRMVQGRLVFPLNHISPWDQRLSVLYRITVRQNAISKRAYDYFENIKKNSVWQGGIFAPTPSELRGNIVCTTDPSKPVIGFIDVSTTTTKYRFISRRDGVYERPPSPCRIMTIAELLEVFGFVPDWFVFIDEIGGYVQFSCVDCTHAGGNLQRPENWPDNF